MCKYCVKFLIFGHHNYADLQVILKHVAMTYLWGLLQLGRIHLETKLQKCIAIEITIFNNFHLGTYVAGYAIRNHVFCSHEPLAHGELLLSLDVRPQHLFQMISLPKLLA